MNFDDELVHLIIQIVRHTLKDVRPGFVGHVVDYDPTSHIVRLMAPAFPVVDETGSITGEYGQTGWLQLATMEGHQAAPHMGSATKTDGDQYYAFVIEKAQGTGLVISKTYNDNEPPPFTDLLPGEWGYKNRDSKSYIRFRQTGEIDIFGQHTTFLTIDKNGQVTIQGPQGNKQLIQVNSDGSIELQTPQGQQVSMDSLGNTIILGGGGQGVVLDKSGNVSVAPSGNGKILLGGLPGAPLIARVGDKVTSDGTPGGTTVGFIATGSTMVESQ